MNDDLNPVLRWFFTAPGWLVGPAFVAVITVSGVLVGRLLTLRARRAKTAGLQPVDPLVAARTRKRRRILLGATAVLLVGLLITQLIRVIAAGSELATSRAELKVRVGSWTVEREPWLDPATDGDSWPAYEEVAREITAMTPEEKATLHHAGDTRVEEGVWADCRRIVKRHGALLTALRTAAAHRAVTVPVQEKRGHIGATASLMPTLSGLRSASELISASAKLRSDDGDWDGAVDAIVVGLQTGCDLCRNSPLIPYLGGRAVTGITLQAAALLLKSPSIPAAAAGRLSRLLDRLGQEMPSLQHAARAEGILVGESLTLLLQGKFEDMDQEIAAGLRMTEWRNGFSLSIAALDVDREWNAYVIELGQATSLPWKDANEIRMRWMARSLGGPHRRPILMAFFPDLTNVEESSRLVMAHLALARAAARYRAGIDEPLPVDPFTLGRIHAETRKDVRVFWSEGTDGDQGGTGDWWGGTSLSRRPDTVLEVPK